MLQLFRVNKCFDQSKRKLHIMLRDTHQPSVPPESDEQPVPSPLQIRDLLQKALEEIGGRRALGAAPPGAMEEILRNAVDAKQQQLSSPISAPVGGMWFGVLQSLRLVNEDWAIVEHL